MHSMEERLQKLMAQAGIASRRKAEEMIEHKLVTVNGRVAHLGDKADPAVDDIRVAGQRLKVNEKLRYIIMNKRRGVVSSTADPEGRTTVIDVLGEKVKERVYPVGRLDIDSDGLVLLTNDGDLANHLTHPRYGCEKTYKVLVEGTPNAHKLEQWRAGVMLDGEKTAPCKVKVLSDDGEGNTWLRIVMREGKKRQIRRIAEQLGHPVKRLTRTHIGAIALGNLSVGQFRDLTPAEIQQLKAAPIKHERQRRRNRRT